MFSIDGLSSTRVVPFATHRTFINDDSLQRSATSLTKYQRRGEKSPHSAMLPYFFYMIILSIGHEHMMFPPPIGPVREENMFENPRILFPNRNDPPHPHTHTQTHAKLSRAPHAQAHAHAHADACTPPRSSPHPGNQSPPSTSSRSRNSRRTNPPPSAPPPPWS